MTNNNWTRLNNEVKVIKDGRYQLEKDKEAVKDYMVNYVNQNTVFFHDLEEKIDYLIKNEYYDSDTFDKYTFKQVKNVFKLAYARKFRFPSFMSAFKFYNNYALKTDDGSKFLERYEDRVSVNALFLADGDFEKAKNMVQVLINQEYQPATPTFLNAARKRSGDLVSCFLLTCPDTTEGIMYIVESSAQLSRNGGGVGINLSKLRANNDPIKSVQGAGSGIVGVAKLLEDTFSYFNQLGQRNGSGVAYLNLFHMDIDDFLATKKINADEKSRLKTLSIGVIAPNKFFELAEKDEPYFVFSPYDVKKEYGIELDDIDMDEMYDKLVANENIRKEKKDARKMINSIAKLQQESGYPYWLFSDNANEVNPLKDIGRIEMSNLCSEILQVQKSSDIKGYGKENKFGYDINCNLGSLNIANVMENKNPENTVEMAIESLNSVANKTKIDTVPSVQEGNKLFKSIGLGAMNLHGYLAKNGIMYDSEEARDFANVFFAMVRYHAIAASNKISKRTGFKFHGFEKSEYTKGVNGNVFKKYVEKDYLPKTKRVEELFKGFNLPTKKDWEDLASKVSKEGLANSYLMAIAPTGSISYIQSATPSVHPITEAIETRTYGDSTTHYPMPFMTNENIFYYTPAYDISMFKYLDMIATIQEHVDQGISTTLFVDSNKTSAELAQYYIYAQKLGLKTLYYTRTKLLSIEECESCSV